MENLAHFNSDNDGLKGEQHFDQKKKKKGEQHALKEVQIMELIT